MVNKKEEVILKANPEDFFEGGNFIMGVMAWL